MPESGEFFLPAPGWEQSVNGGRDYIMKFWGLVLALHRPAPSAETGRRLYLTVKSPDLGGVETSDPNIRVDNLEPETPWKLGLTSGKLEDRCGAASSAGTPSWGRLIRHLKFRPFHTRPAGSASIPSPSRLRLRFTMPSRGHVNLRTGDGSIRPERV